MNVAEIPGFFFLDTNVFVYSFDHTSPTKRDVARSLIGDALESQRGIISTQVVQEFLNVSQRKFATPLTGPEASLYLSAVLTPLCRHIPSVDFYAYALLLQNETGFSFYDALIVAAALESGCSTLFSEDLQDGQVVRGLRIRNPFLLPSTG